MRPLKDFRNAAVVGIVPAAMETALILAVEPGINRWHLSQAVLFWFTCGFVVYLADTGLKPILHGVALTALLNLPWFIAEGILPGKYDHVLPLVTASVVAGLVIGSLKRWMDKEKVANAAQ